MLNDFIRLIVKGSDQDLRAYKSFEDDIQEMLDRVYGFNRYETKLSP